VLVSNSVKHFRDVGPDKNICVCGYIYPVL
jgi:hypothetical protein